MAMCKHCGRDMAVSTTCTCLGNKTVRFPDGAELPSVPCKENECRRGRCVDCNAIAGGNHHPGCDREKCPRCQGQLIACGCLEKRA